MESAGGERGKMDRELHDRDLSPAPNRRDAGAQLPWLRAARLVLATLCLVVASLAGNSSGRSSPAAIGAAPDTAPTNADAQRDSVRNLLRPQVEIVAKAPTWRSADPAGPQPDSHTGAIPAPRQGLARLAGAGVDAVSSDIRGPRWLALRAGYSRAPPTAIGRLRTSA